jgi:FtsP/CotA-like multicopper oxidase with cupredoxin domain
MDNRKILNLLVLVSMLASLLLMGGVSPASAMNAQAPSAAASSSVSAMPISPVDETKVPHYFGPWPNWVMSPFTLPDAVVTIAPAGATPVSVGNPLIARQYASDDTVGGAGSGTPGQGTVLVVIPTQLPAGTLQNFQTYVQNAPPLASPGNTFNAYVLHPTGNLNEYTVVFDSGPLTVPSMPDGIQTWPVSGSPAVVAGDVIAFYGQGIPLDLTGTDLVAYPAPAAPTGTFVVDSAGFPLIAARTYSFAATVSTGPGPGSGATAVASVGANGAVTGLTVTNPGSGYDPLNPPSVTINNAAGTNTTASAVAVVSTSGVVASITVDPLQQGAGYISPYITIALGDGAGATATAYGGVDLVDIALTPAAGFSMPFVTFDLPDDPAGTPATGHVICLGDPNPPDPATPPCTTPDPAGATTVTVTGIHVDTAGSGYSSAPRFVVRDGTVANPINNRAATAGSAARSKALKTKTAGSLSRNETALAQAAAAVPSGQAPLHILYAVMDTYGAGYTTANLPTVTIADSTGTPSSLAAATANIEVGAVTGFTNLVGGSGYLTTGGIKKFQDGLPMLCDPSVGCTGNNLGQYIPLAVPDITTFPDDPLTPQDEGADYYVIALVQHREQMNSSLPPIVTDASGNRTGGTLLREYVQLETATNASWSKSVELTNDLLDGTSVPAMMSDGNGGFVRAVAVDDPHYMGPIIQTQKDRPVRIVFYNLLPTGSDGDLFIPVDTTFMGAGMGPMDMMPPDDLGTVMDGVRNPMCGETDRNRMDCFADTRASIHLHGGITPWISDGSPHQWITPANEQTGWPEGVAVRQVPDMVGGTQPAGVPDCSADNDGCSTFYYTNQQSARFMFYHDHAWGITRLNVYAGEAAGYLIRDDTEKKLIADGLIPSGAAEIPLVIQDRTFVPQDTQLYDVKDATGNIVSYGQDPTWDKTRWGGYGDLWYEHVYMPATNPYAPDGLSTVGRWFYGPYFWPPATPQYGEIANPYYNMDPATGFSTPLAVPCNLNDSTTWQYDTDPFCEPPTIPGTPNNSAGMEEFNDTPIVNGTAYPTTTVEPKAYRLRMLNAANDRFFNFQWYVADPTQCANPADPTTCTEVALDPALLAAAQTDPNVFPVPLESMVVNGQPVDLRGPDWIQIGTEGGFLPAPVVVDGQQETTWIIDPTRFDVGNVLDHSLLIAPAERADVIVDFSKFAGKTLILYNDAPAAFPARIATYDYYTGAPDLSPAGAPTILAGYGPNTRTIMQVNVAAAPVAPAFNLTALQNAFKHHVDGSGVFESGQAPTIVGQAGYNSAYGTSFAALGWCNDPAASATAPCDGYVRINEQGYDQFKFNTLMTPTAQISVTIQPKAIHDETNSTNFEPYGRMTGNLGVEVVPAGPNTQNVVLYPFVNPTTENFDGTSLPTTGNLTPISVGTDGTQIWKFTHNGVDTHPIHFHLYDVQVLNRATWDNIIIPPDATELGWKDTVRVSPLEDTYFAIRPIIPVLPWELPNSIRPQNPMMPPGDQTMFNNVDPNGNPTNPIVNQLVNFGWEYMIHCHILSHEEMDMMRPVTVAMPPVAPSGLTFSFTGNGNNRHIVVSFMDNSVSETGYALERSIDGTTWTQVATLDIPLDPVNAKDVTRSITDPTSNANTAYLYRVVALNTVGYGLEFPSMTVQSTPSPSAGVNAPAAPTSLTATLQAGPQVSLTWRDNATNETGFVIQRSTDNVNFSQIATAPARNNTGTVGPVVDSSAQLGTTYYYRVGAVNVAGTTWSANLPVTVAAPSAPTILNLTAVRQGGTTSTNERVTVTWNVSGSGGAVANYRVQWSTTATGPWTQSPLLAPSPLSYTTGNITRQAWYFQVGAINALGTTWSSSVFVARAP